MNILNIHLISFIKFIGINLVTCYCYFKIQNSNTISRKKQITILLLIIILTILQCILQPFTPQLLRIFLIYFILSIILSKMTYITLEHSILTVLISQSISYVISYISLLCVLLFIKLFITNFYVSNTIIIIINIFLNILLSFLLFKIKRFKNGFIFIKNFSLKNDLNFFILIISAIVIFMYFFIYFIKTFSAAYLSAVFIILSLILFFMIKKTFIFYHKQKLQLQTLKDYETELIEVKTQLTRALSEKERLIKSNHEFYHRQESLNRKLDILISQIKTSQNINTEFSEDYSDILNRINNLSNEYISKTSIIPNLEKTEIAEIDDMLSYMQSECIKNNIDFILKINCNVHYMIENLITISQLETLLGDLIRNSIIAINHSSKEFRSIMVIFGIKDENYELCIYDSGIPFKIDTLLNLGIIPASTHLDEGGSGIGFITTFETINSCNSSFIINEITNNNYSKSLEIKFDNKNEYIIISNRKQEIKNKFSSENHRNIILK